MKSAILLSAFACTIALSAYAQVSSQVSVPTGATVTTTVQSPNGTVTTSVATPVSPSVKTKLADGSTVEMDSDGSVYKVYPDGARVAAPDGVNTLYDGSTVTVKDGKRIP
jgi:hypothetical protein